jgi:NitT/TauT family transport system ATP-binding protein
MRDKKTVVFVTHDIREALVLGDRVVVMAGRPGRVLQDLEVRLDRPRDPDHPALVDMSRRIRAMLGSADVAGETPPPLARKPETTHEEPGDRAGRVPDGPPDPLGAHV